jgi:hypothetical protein
MCLPPGDSSGGSAPDADAPGPRQSAARESGSSSLPATNATAEAVSGSTGAATEAGSSAAGHDAAHNNPVTSGAAALADHASGGQDPRAPATEEQVLTDPIRTAPAPVEISFSGSSTATAPAAYPVPSQPTTHLSQGITRPKLRTDGTVCWGMTTTVSKEPASIREALHDSNWLTAMN